MIAQILSTMFAVLAGYVLGVWHMKRAVRDALDQLEKGGGSGTHD